MTASKRADVALRALDGKAAPPKLGADLEHLGGFPGAAKKDFWNALGPSLDEPINQEAEHALEAYCQRHGLDDVILAKVISASRFLIRESARRALSEGDVEADIRALVGDRKDIVQSLASGYRAGLAHLTKGFAARSVAAHGGVLRQVDWRLERVIASNEARHLDFPIAFMALTTDGPKGARSTSLQLDMPSVLKLKQACEGILESADRLAGPKKGR